VLTAVASLANASSPDAFAGQKADALVSVLQQASSLLGGGLAPSALQVDPLPLAKGVLGAVQASAAGMELNADRAEGLAAALLPLSTLTTSNQAVGSEFSLRVLSALGSVVEAVSTQVCNHIERPRRQPLC
jgi:hypothetical protein